MHIVIFLYFMRHFNDVPPKGDIGGSKAGGWVKTPLGLKSV